MSLLHGPSARSAVAPFYVMQVFVAAEERRSLGLPVYNLAIGQPGTPAPAVVREAARQVLDDHRLGYTGALGLPELREAIARHVADWYGIEVPTANVVVTTGSSGGFLAAFLSAFEAGDVVAMPRPGYPAYRNILTSLGCTVAEFDCGPEQGFVPTVEMLDALDEVPAGLVLASPNNPTGAMVPPERLAAIAAWCRQRGVRLVSDEIYHGISHSGPGACAWQFDRSAIVVNSFSKYFSMTGWRIGWLLVPDELLDAVDRLIANYTICPPTLSQLAAVAAFDAHDELAANVARYAENRALLLEALPAIGLGRLAPADGAFYLYADVCRQKNDSQTFCARMLAEASVAASPGLDFDRTRGNRTVRFSYCGPEADMVEASTRLTAWRERLERE